MEDWNELYERAWEIASKAHQGQTDKGGHPYIGHPVAVADMVLTPEEKVVALLHDVVEDTSVTLQDLKQEFPAEVVEAVDLLTKKKGPDFSLENYLKDIRENEIARQVKLADLKHNMDLSRIANPTQRDLLRLEQYKNSKDYLEGKKKER